MIHRGAFHLLGAPKWRRSSRDGRSSPCRWCAAPTAETRRVGSARRRLRMWQVWGVWGVEDLTVGWDGWDMWDGVFRKRLEGFKKKFKLSKLGFFGFAWVFGLCDFSTCFFFWSGFSKMYWTPTFSSWNKKRWGILYPSPHSPRFFAEPQDAFRCWRLAGWALWFPWATNVKSSGYKVGFLCFAWLVSSICWFSYQSGSSSPGLDSESLQEGLEPTLWLRNWKGTAWKKKHHFLGGFHF